MKIKINTNQQRNCKGDRISEQEQNSNITLFCKFKKINKSLNMLSREWKI